MITVTNFLSYLVLVSFIMVLCSELGELILILMINSWKIPKRVKLVDTDFENCILSTDNTMIHINNSKYSYISKTPFRISVKYHIKTYNYEKLIPIFRFTKNSKLIDNKFKELKNK